MERLEQREHFAAAARPSDYQVRVLDTVLRSENCLVKQLVNWGETPDAVARLVLKWPGSTSAVRAFTSKSTTDVCQPRSVFVTKLDEDRLCKVDSDAPEYAPLMWPLAFPSGEPSLLHTWENGWRRPSTTAVDSKSGFKMAHTALAMMLQPERNDRGDFVTVPTASPYGAGHPDVLRRFSRFELMGRLGRSSKIWRCAC